MLQQGLLGDICKYPAIFGHEGSGIVRAIGSNVKDKTIAVGDPVCLSFVTCGDCEQCKLGHPAFCWNFTECNHFAQRYSDKKSAATLEDGSRVGSMYFGHSSFSRLSVVKDQCVVKYPGTDIENMGIYAAVSSASERSDTVTKHSQGWLWLSNRSRECFEYSEARET